MELNKVKYSKFIFPIIVGLIIWFASPIKPDAVSLVAWHMLAIFVATIIGCITQPLPIAGVALIGFVLSIITGTVTMDVAITGFGNDTVWMIAMAYLMSRGFINTGLGRRVALIFVRLFGKRTLGLAYSLIGVDLVTSPATPSNTARAGGIVYPIIKSLAETFGSDPKDGTERKMGSFLVFAEYHGNIITSALFMTAMAPNLVASQLAGSMHIHLSWGLWFLAAIVPAVICIICVPWFIYKMYPPEIKESPNARQWADDELASMGKMSLAEKIMGIVFLVALVLWMLSSVIEIEASTVAFLAVVLLLITGVLSINDVLHETGAWNTLIWFSILIFMATQLTKLGFIPWMSKAIGLALHGVSWGIVLAVLVVFYFYSHYLFASGTAHVSAMYAALLGVAVSAGAPGVFAALMLGYTAALFNSTTHFASGPATVMFGAGYVKQSDWWRMNFVLGLFYLVVWGGIGSLWMKVLGLW